MAIREGKWKCTYCGATNRGRDLECTACGAAREKDVSFFLDDDAAEVTDEAVVAHARGGAEWICETCGASNGSERETCLQCGASRGESVRREARFIPIAPPPVAPAAAPVEKTGCLERVGVPLLATSAVILLLLVGLGYWLTRSETVQLTVSSAEWQRNVEVEELQTLTEKAWEDEVPSGARVLSRARELHHNERVQVGTTSRQESYTERVQVGTRRVKTGVRDLGNGYFEDVYKDEPVYENRTKTRTVQEPVYEERPVYRNRVTYQVDRWKPVRTETAQGQNLTPAWPAVSEGSKRRIGKRESKYVVTFYDAANGRTFVEEVGESDFSRYAPGTVVTGKVNNFGSLVEFE